MAKGELQIKGDANAAMQSFVNAVTYMGGSVTSMNPSRPVEFSVRRSGGMMGGMGAPYGGTATFVPTANGQTRVLVELRPRAWYTAIFVVIALVALGAVGAVGGEEDVGLMAMGILVTVVTAWTLYSYYVPWQKQVIDKLQMGVHGAVSAFDMPAAAPAAPAHGAAFTAAPDPAAPASATPSASAALGDQLRQLAELHRNGLITDAEFEAKKADVLKRL